MQESTLKRGDAAVNLFPYQEKVLKATENYNRVAYYLDMGLG